jgi:hypothetical protein
MYMTLVVETSKAQREEHIPQTPIQRIAVAFACDPTPPITQLANEPTHSRKEKKKTYQAY